MACLFIGGQTCTDEQMQHDLSPDTSRVNLPGITTTWCTAPFSLQASLTF